LMNQPCLWHCDPSLPCCTGHFVALSGLTRDLVIFQQQLLLPLASKYFLFLSLDSQTLIGSTHLYELCHRSLSLH
jgi:hypothetical protein